MKKTQALPALIGIILFAGFFGYFLAGERTGAGENIDADMVLFGDSIFANDIDGDTMDAGLQEKLGIRVFNGAFGGRGASYLEREGLLDHAGDVYSMAALSLAIRTKDIRIQKYARVRENGTGYFAERAEQLSRIDFADVDTVLIEYLLNDYQTGVPVDNESDPEDEYTYCGAIRSSVRRLREMNPELRIILVSPAFGWYPTADGTGTETTSSRDFGQGTIERYLEAQKRLAEELGLGWIDLYTDLYEHESFSDWMRYTYDGIHPNENGRELILERIAEYMEETP